MGYPEAFLTERPHDGLDAVQGRLKKGKVLHEQFANYFKERAHIEDLYAKSIIKAFQKHITMDSEALGSFTAPWEKLSAESTELATLHGQFSLRISNEIEKPLRDYARTHPEWQNLTLAETNCNRIAKEFDEKQAKVTKYTKAVERVSGKKADAAEQKLMEYTKQLESTRTAWRLEGPVILQKYQNVDQARLEHLKQTVTLFESIQTDTALQVVELSGVVSSSAAEFDPLMDVELFASEKSTNLHSIEPYDGASIMSTTSHKSNGDTVGSLEARRSNGNGVHKRGMTGSSQLSNVSFSTDRSHAQSKAASVDHTRTADTAQEHVRSGSSVLGSALDVPINHVDAEGFSIPPPDNSPWSDAGTNSHYDDEHSETSSFSQAPSKMHMEIRQDSVSESNDEAKAALERVTSTLKQTKTISRRHPGRREVRSMYQSEDSLSAYNSFQSSPLSSAFTPDTATPPAMASPGSRAFFSQSSSHLQTGPAPFSPALARASTLGLPSSSQSSSHLHHSIPPTPPLPLSNGSGSVSILGGQALAAEPESVTAAPLVSSEGAAPVPSAVMEANSGAALKPEAWVATVVEKIHAHTQGGEVAKMMVAGEVYMTTEGFLRTAKDPKKVILRLGHLQNLEKHVPNPAYLSPVEGAESGAAYWVDLEVLSKAVQHQQQQLQQAQQQPGVVVLKYQVKTLDEESRQQMLPLLIQPAWKCEAHQTSLLINYKANAHCKLTGSATAVVAEGGEGADDIPTKSSTATHLSEVSFLVPVSGEVANVQSRPTGIWSGESNKMFWDVDDVVMSLSPEPHKLLARFELNSAGNGGPSQPSAAAAKFRVQGQLVSDLVVSLEKEKKHREGEAMEGVDNADADMGAGDEGHIGFGSVRLQVQSGRYMALA